MARLVGRARLWAFITVLFVAGGLATSAGAQPSQSAYDLDAIVKTGVLRIAITDYDLPAFRWREGESLVGPEVDLAKGIADALGVRIEYVPDATSFNGVIDLVAQGKADIGLNKLSQTYARLKLVRFSVPYLTLRQSMLFSRAAVAELSVSEAPDVALRHFHGRIGAIKGTSYVDFARRNWPAATVVEMPDWDTSVDALLHRNVDVLYRDEFEVLRTLQSRPTLNVYAGAAILTDQADFLSIAICNTCQKLQDFINFHLGQVRGAMTLRRLMAASADH